MLRLGEVLPLYGWVGAVVMAVSEVAMLAKIEPFWSWHTPIAWSGYIMLVDALVWKRRGRSWLTTSRREFVFLALVSIPLWLVFEFFNLFIRNWQYVNLPENPVWRTLGYAWSFATIWPAIFETGELVASLRARPGDRRSLTTHGSRMSAAMWLSVGVGTAMLVWPVVAGSPYLAAPVWLGFIFLLDPWNTAFGGEALLLDYRNRRWDRTWNLMISGLACGVVWEFWNYWARTKWIYAVPILTEWKIFEMPLAGYFGFPAFALECFTMYVAARRLLWRGPSRPISL
ncbi:MAG: hypothetical protein HYX76_05410 [Acidobacteria bacterium]|nr:hypothetical protein [Acidobacteriota bacterium]